jgi:hypothetical protein
MFFSCWSQSCAILRTLPYLRTLTITLECPGIRTYRDCEVRAIFPPLVNVNVKEKFVVYVDWMESEREVPEGAPFRVVRSKKADPVEETTREQSSFPRAAFLNSSEI